MPETIEQKPEATAVQALPRIDLDSLPDHYEITETELANAIGKKIGTLRVWRARKIGIPFLRYGRQIRYVVRDVKAYRAGQRVRFGVVTDKTGRSVAHDKRRVAELAEVFGETTT